MAANSFDNNAEKLQKIANVWDDTKTLVTDFGRLLNDEKYSDVLFIVGENEQEFRAHSLILKARCLKYQDEKSTANPIYKQTWLPDVFHNVLEYIYTGQIELSSSNALETLKIAVELDLSKLISKCEEYFLKELSVENCCEFYIDTMNIRDDELISTCQSFIEQNASDVVLTQGFLNLSKDALIQLISSDKFSLEEDDVWRSVFRWSRTRAKVEAPLQDWTDTERENVCKHLAGVIGHVRLLLVDSKVFAEEIEPTGAVPMELSLERYRYAAVPQKFSDHDDIKLRPRVRNKKFPGTTILWKNNSKYQDILNKWFDKDHQEWQLVYKASKDGFSSETFHEKCDDFPKTLTIVQGHNGYICGGYSEVPWKYDNGNGKYSQSSSCFLFNLANSEGIPPTRFDVVRPKYATLSHASLGPTFGAGPDLSISHNCNLNTDSLSKLSNSYGGENASRTSLMGVVNFKIADYEVFVPKLYE